jgi:type VI secretion system protein ImpC
MSVSSSRDGNAARTRIAALVRALDTAISRQLDAVLHRPEFQRLEATWRGLAHLADESQPDEHIQLRVLNVTKPEALADLRESTLGESGLGSLLDRAARFHDECWYACVVGDFEFDKIAEDVELLGLLGQLATRSHTLFITAPGAQMFGLPSLTDLPSARDLSQPFLPRPENRGWLALRGSDDSRSIVMTLPRVLRRAAYTREASELENFAHQECVSDVEDLVWGNAAFDYARVLERAFAQHHWVAAIRGREGGGRIDDLPAQTVTAPDGSRSRFVLEADLGDDLEVRLSELGFLALLPCRGTDDAAFFGGGTLHRPRAYDSASATAAARASASVLHVMGGARIAHYLKAICRDSFGQVASREACERPSPAGSALPLKSASLVAKRDPSDPELWVAVLDLCYALPLDGAPHRFVVELPVSFADAP